MNLLDIVGPVMVGPSSSHTAGACKIGNIGRKLFGEPIRRADIYLHGSFLSTGKGHGTDRALVAGLLGFGVGDIRIPQSCGIAEERGMEFHFYGIDLGDVHPNSVKMILKGEDGRQLEMCASSIGGGRIKVNQIDDLEVNFSGDYPTLIVRNVDEPGLVKKVTDFLQENAVNIAAMELKRKTRGGHAVMILECDEELTEELLQKIRSAEGVLQVTYLSLKEEKEDV